jgi:flavodoxin
MVMKKSIVIYASSTGNTEKVAKVVSDELACSSVKLNEEFNYNDINLKEYDLVIIGTGIYAGKPHKNLIKFLKSIDEKTSKKFGLFITWFGRANGDKQVFNTCKQILVEKNQILIEDYFQCYGKGFVFIKKGHPNQEELLGAKNWAKEILKSRY